MKKVLVVARQSPVPPSSGSTQRTNLLLRALARRYLVDLVVVSHLPNTQERGQAVGGATLVDYLLLPIVEPAPRKGGGRAWSFASRTRKALSFNFGFREVPLVSRAVRDIARRGQYEWVVVRYLSTFAQCGLEALPNVIVDVDDLPAEAFRTAVAGRAGNPGQWLYNQAKVAGLAWQTARFASRCRHVWVPNPEQVPLFPNASCLPNIPFPFFSTGEAQLSPGEAVGGTVMFVGLMGYGPNQEAVRNFVARTWPAIHREVPDSRLEIVGGGCPENLKRAIETGEAVHLSGYREDLAQAYWECSVAIAPMTAGAGTSIKVLEAMYHGKPCVLSRFASRGLLGLLRDGENVMIAADDRDFAARVVALLRDAALRRKIGSAAQVAVRESYGFEHFDRCVHDTIASLGSR